MIISRRALTGVYLRENIYGALLTFLSYSKRDGWRRSGLRTMSIKERLFRHSPAGKDSKQRFPFQGSQALFVEPSIANRAGLLSRYSSTIFAD